MYLNLLPRQTRLKIQFRCLLRCYLLIWGLGGLVIAAYGAMQGVHVWRAHQQVAELELRCQPVYALQEQIANDQQQLLQLQARFEKLSQLRPANHFLDVLGVLVQATRAEAGKLHIQRLSLLSGQATSTNNAGSAKKSSSPAITTSTLSLSGLAADDAALTQFVASLRTAGVFEQVDLKSSSQVGGADRAARQYQIECRYQDTL